MMGSWKFLRVAIVASLLMLGGSANAALVNVNIAGIFTAVPPSLITMVPVGSALSMDLLLDDAERNLVSAPDYHAISPGTLSSFLIIAVPGTVDDIALTDATGTWVGLMSLDLTAVLGPGVFLPVVTTLVGTGYTPGQILPDFSFPLTSGVMDIDATLIGAPEPFLASVTGITVTPIPEPGTALLVGLGLIAVAGSRRRHS